MIKSRFFQLLKENKTEDEAIDILASENNTTVDEIIFALYEIASSTEWKDLSCLDIAADIDKIDRDRLLLLDKLRKSSVYRNDLPPYDGTPEPMPERAVHLAANYWCIVYDNFDLVFIRLEPGQMFVSADREKNDLFGFLIGQALVQI